MLTDFDASKVQPMQPGGMGGHPPGIFPFTITNSYLKPSNNQQHLMFNVELTSDVGKIEERFIVDGPSQQAIEIAQKQISALCHAVNIYRVSFPKNPDGSPIMDQAGRELRGGRGRMEVAPQMKDGKETGYMEVKKFFDVNGNEPGKQGAAPQPMQQQPAPQQQNASAPLQQQGNGGWGTPPAQQQPQQQPAQQPQQQSGGWQQQQPQGGGTTQPPPWSRP